MAKTKPIGVRFDEEILNELGGTAQSVLITLENMYKASQSISKNFLTSDKPVFKPENIAIAIPKNENITVTYEEPKTDNSEIEKQIAAVKSEVKPAFIDKSKFEKYKEKRINELKKQLK